MLIQPLATTAWHILRLQMTEPPPAGGLQTYQEDMDSRQGVVPPSNSPYYKMLKLEHRKGTRNRRLCTQY